MADAAATSAPTPGGLSQSDQAYINELRKDRQEDRLYNQAVRREERLSKREEARQAASLKNLQAVQG